MSGAVNLKQANKDRTNKILRVKAVKMRAQGYTVDQIRRACGWRTNAQTRDNIRKEIKSQAHEELKDVMYLELLRVDRMHHVLQDIYDNDDPEADRGRPISPRTKVEAINSAIRVAERRAAFLGLDQMHKETDHSAVDDWLNDVTDPEVIVDDPDEDDGIELTDDEWDEDGEDED